MFQKITTHFGQWLSIIGTAITTSFQGGTSVALEGCEEIDAQIIASFDAATTITTMDFQLQVSDDGTTWDPVASIKGSTGAVGITQSISASAGQTVRDRLQISQAALTTFRAAKYARIAVKSTGASKSGDSASSNLNFNSY